MVDVTHATPNALSAAAANANAPYSVVWDTTGAQPGTYRILSTAVNASRGSLLLGACSGTAGTGAPRTFM